MNRLGYYQLFNDEKEPCTRFGRKAWAAYHYSCHLFCDNDLSLSDEAFRIVMPGTIVTTIMVMLTGCHEEGGKGNTIFNFLSTNEIAQLNYNYRFTKK